METKILTNDEEKYQAELLRNEVYHFPELLLSQYKPLVDNKVFAIATYDEGEIIAVCYFHRFNTTLMIDEIFVKESYQNNGIGSALLQGVVNSKSQLEKLLGGELTACRLEPRGEDVKKFYIKNDFHSSSNDNMYKAIK